MNLDAAGDTLSNEALDHLLIQLSGVVSISIGSLSQLHGLPLHQINNAVDGSHVLTEAEDKELLESVAGVRLFSSQAARASTETQVPPSHSPSRPASRPS